MSLISGKELRAAAARVAAKELLPAPGYTYVPRTKTQWHARMDQTHDGSPVAEPTSPFGGFVETRRQYICCKNCGHWRSRHCTKRIVRKPKTGAKPRRAKFVISDSGAVLREEDKWRGFADESGHAAPCRHTPEDPSINYACNSTACAFVVDDENFCSCQKFVSPYIRPSALPLKSRSKKAEIQAELFPSGEAMAEGFAI
jgi:hypothetical protein